MNFDFTITFAVIVSFISILSPIIVSIINNRYQFKMKKFDNYDLEKRKTFEKFLKDAGEYLVYPNGTRKINLGNSLYSLLAYFEVNIDDLEEIINKQEKSQPCKDEINELIEKLKKQL